MSYDRDALVADLGLITPLVRKFLEEAGDSAKIFDEMVESGFDPNVMVEQCGETARGHGFWDAHLEQALAASDNPLPRPIFEACLALLEAGINPHEYADKDLDDWSVPDHVEKALQTLFLYIDSETNPTQEEPTAETSARFRGLLDAIIIHTGCLDGLRHERLLGDPTIFMALIMTEVGEAIEAYRKGNRVGKDGMWEELADVVVRLFDFIARYGPDDEMNGPIFMSLVAAKMAKNESRPHLHGKGF